MNKNKLLRYVSFIIAAVLIVSAFSGCGSDDDKNTVSISNGGGKYDMIVTSSEGINCDYLLVYHDGISYSELDSYVDLLEQLSIASTSSFQICPDNLNVPKEDQKLILLGEVSYAVAEKAESIMADIRSNSYYDYLFLTSGNQISVIWQSKFGREDAFSHLLNTLLPKGLDKLYAQSYSYMYLSDRSDSPIVTIDDINIVQYSIVIPAAPSYLERTDAQNLAEIIENATGVEIPVVTDVIEESKYEILIGDTNRGETYTTSFFANSRYAIVQYGTKLVVRGGQVEATSNAVAILSNMIENAHITAAPLHIKNGYCKTGSTEGYVPTVLNGYKLVVYDEFDGTTVDDTKWTVEDGNLSSYGSNQTLMYYDKKNVRMDGNNLEISTYLGERGYTSGNVSSFDKFKIKYGYVEVRAKFRAAPGYWVQCLLTNQDANEDTITNIDVFNVLGSKEAVFASAGTFARKDYYSSYLGIYKDKYDCYREGRVEGEQYFSDECYHTFGLEWTETTLRFFMDGILYGTVEITANKYKSLNKELYLSFICGVEMTDQEADDEAANWPAPYSIDWVRVYQKDGAVYKTGKFAE